jgi:hypothetical protein
MLLALTLMVDIDVSVTRDMLEMGLTVLISMNA